MILSRELSHQISLINLTKRRKHSAILELEELGDDVNNYSSAHVPTD